jgi:hypothetical protein
VISEIGDYVFTVLVAAEGARAREKKLHVMWNGDWETFEVREA